MTDVATGTNRERWAVWLLRSAVLVGAAWLYGRTTVMHDYAGAQRVVIALAMGVLGFASVFAMPRVRGAAAWLLVLVPAIVLRMAILPAAPSDDVHRYLWEGRLVEQGVDPYEYVAAAPERAEYRDYEWELMNHKDKPTAYPPLLLQIFAAINQFGYEWRSYQLVFAVADVLVILLLMGTLSRLGRPVRWAAFYALCPVPVISYAAEAHADILMVLPLMAAVYFAVGGSCKCRAISVGVCLAIAVHMKIMVLVAVPMLLWRMGWRGWLAFIGAALMLLSPWWMVVDDVARGLALFGSTRSFNGPVYQLLEWLGGGSRVFANTGVIVGYGALWLWAMARVARTSVAPWRMAAVALMGLVLLSPTVHYWYLAWILPFAALQPRLSWSVLMVSASLYFLVWTVPAESWGLPVWARWAFWLPAALCLGWELAGRGRRRMVVENDGEVTVVIPALRPSEGLEAALASVRRQSSAAAEIIVVDVGEMGPLDGVRRVQSEPGRGAQIRAGVEAARSDWVLILHADAVLPHDAIEQIHLATSRDSSVVGGCLGQRFDSGGRGLLIVETLNELRGTFSQTSFGDQAQFLHRPTAIECECLTSQKLMEDVEMSDRLRKCGELLYLGNEVVVSADKWRRDGFWKRFCLIVEFFWRYRLKFWRPKAEREALAEELVARYYGRGS